MKKNIKKLFLAAGLLAITGALLTGCGSKKKNAEEESVIKISTAPEPTATPDPKTVDPDAVTSNGNLTMVNEYLAENGSEALGIDGVTPTPAASDGSTEAACALCAELSDFADTEAQESLALEVEQAAEPQRFIAVQADVSRFDEAKRLINEVKQQFGRIDVLVNNCLLYTSPSPRD